MIERFETLLLGVAAAAVLLGVALSLARGSALRAVLRFAGGLAILLAVLQPLSGVRLPSLSGLWGQAAAESRAQSAPYTAAASEALAGAAVRQVEAEIEARAGALGVPCTAVLQTAPGEAGQTYVTGVTLSCPAAAQAGAGAVERMLEEECGITKENVTWNWIE